MQLSKSVNRKAVSQVTEWIRSKLSCHGKNHGVQIMVTEVECREEGCVPIEVLVILIGPTKRWTGKLLKPISEVLEIDMEELDLPNDVEAQLEPAVSPPMPSREEVSYVQMRQHVGPQSITSLTPNLPASDLTTVPIARRAQHQQVVMQETDFAPKARHDKVVRIRGCPCCDPDNMENIIDKILFMNTPP